MKESHYFSKYFESVGQKLNSIDPTQLEQAAAMVWAAHKTGKKVPNQGIFTIQIIFQTCSEFGGTVSCKTDF